jgi:argonaute-like protein implicated in RNA metabolism and viral defense
MIVSSLPTVQLAFGGGQYGTDKLRGLLAHGPFRCLENANPRLGFVFPNESRDYGNRLFLALKNGIGLFRGVENTFRFGLSKEQVFSIPVTGVQLTSSADHERNAIAYADAILSWQSKRQKCRPDLFFVMHPKTSESDRGTPYYKAKALLLKEGILSQNVTLDLLNNPSQFEWSAANIALGAFVKLGGVPWVVGGKELDQDLIIGLGRAFLFDYQTRQTTGYLAFTECFSARGPLKFISLAKFTNSKEQYLEALGNVITSTLNKAEAQNSHATSLTVHAPKEMRRDEMRVINEAVQSHQKKNVLNILLAKVTEEFSFFALDDRFRDGVPRRGTVVQVSDRDYMLYTEGRDEREPWSNRVPVALRVTPQGGPQSSQNASSILRQINDLSQVNWRGFNARSKPISVYYGNLIARLLSHLDHASVEDLHKQGAAKTLEERMWFL